MVPTTQRFARMCDKHFTIGEVYPLVVEEPRSMISHKHEFAWLREAWRSLPEGLSDLYPTEEHLRKRALIQAGYCTEVLVDAGSAAAARRMVAAMTFLDEFAFVQVSGSAISIKRAKSQSHRAMGAKDFQQSKTAILAIISEMLGVSPEELRRQGEAA